MTRRIVTAAALTLAGTLATAVAAALYALGIARSADMGEDWLLEDDDRDEVAELPKPDLRMVATLDGEPLVALDDPCGEKDQS